MRLQPLYFIKWVSQVGSVRFQGMPNANDKPNTPKANETTSLGSAGFGNCDSPIQDDWDEWGSRGQGPTAALHDC